FSACINKHEIVQIWQNSSEEFQLQPKAGWRVGEDVMGSYNPELHGVPGGMNL
ncbi:hypothetical protein TorRG33x02_043690, partial [Trema orientale]